MFYLFLADAFLLASFMMAASAYLTEWFAHKKGYNENFSVKEKFSAVFHSFMMMVLLHFTSVLIAHEGGNLWVEHLKYNKIYAGPILCVFVAGLFYFAHQIFWNRYFPGKTYGQDDHSVFVRNTMGTDYTKAVDKTQGFYAWTLLTLASSIFLIGIAGGFYIRFG